MSKKMLKEVLENQKIIISMLGGVSSSAGKTVPPPGIPDLPEPDDDNEEDEG